MANNVTDKLNQLGQQAKEKVNKLGAQVLDTIDPARKNALYDNDKTEILDTDYEVEKNLQKEINYLNATRKSLVYDSAFIDNISTESRRCLIAGIDVRLLEIYRELQILKAKKTTKEQLTTNSIGSVSKKEKEAIKTSRKKVKEIQQVYKKRIKEITSGTTGKNRVKVSEFIDKEVALVGEITKKLMKEEEKVCIDHYGFLSFYSTRIYEGDKLISGKSADQIKSSVISMISNKQNDLNKEINNIVTSESEGE